jgi:thiopeptide-type bacteriocin biosynthesis protein
MFRASAVDPATLDALRRPQGQVPADAEAMRRFIEAAWAVDGLATAVALASPSLARAIVAVLRDDELPPVKVIRAALALARYAVRLRGRATPFGLLAGAALAQVGGQANGIWHADHRPAARADGRWLAALVAQLEGCSSLRQRLRVVANDLISVRGDRFVIPWLPHASPIERKAPVEVSIRRTPPAEAALRLAHSPVGVAELTATLAVEFPGTEASRVDALVAELMACGALVSNLRPPSTVTDGLAHVLDVLGSSDTAGLPDATTTLMVALRDVHSGLRRTSTADLAEYADRMLDLAAGPATPVAIDLRVDHQVIVPDEVAAQAAVAADVLARLSPHLHGTASWQAYHARFLERYGAGAVVPVADLIDPVTGLGLPGHYADRASDAHARAWSGRDERLAAVAQQAALDGALEVTLGDGDIADLVGPASATARTAPHADITIEVRGASTQAVDSGEFTIVVTGTGRTAMATAGRLVHLLPGGERMRLTRACRSLPTATHGAIPAQLSFPPRQPRAENVTRVPRMLRHLVSVAEHHDGDEERIAVGDLGVTADLDRFYLISQSRRAAVEPMLACAPAWHVVPPLARLLFEIPRADCAVTGLFDWAGAASLPFLPRLRWGRAVLSLARWLVKAGDLPGPAADWREWTAALSRLRQRLGLSCWVSVGSGDQQLRLNLDDPMDLAVLRAYLDRTTGSAVITESWTPEDHAWCGGRAHEIVVPLASTAGPVPPPKALTRRGPLPVVGREHGHLPGSEILSARLYGHPDLFESILLGHLPDLADGWADLDHWWFLRYRDPRHHLRLRLHVRDYGQAASRVGRWAAGLRRNGLAGDLLLDTYRPETPRFGGGIAMRTAERLFAADSGAALAQMISARGTDPRPLAAVSLADLAGAVLVDGDAGLRWLAGHPGAASPMPADRAARLEVLALMRIGSAGDDPVPGAVRDAWRARADVAAEYAAQLGQWGMESADVIESLLHLHHNRAIGTDPATESMTYRLARAAALAQMAIRPGSAGSRR